MGIFEDDDFEWGAKPKKKLATKSNENVKKEYTMSELFEITVDGKTTYGFKLAMNSANKLVMEEKGTGQTIVVSPDQVKEVLPYTITVTAFNSDAVRNYIIEPGKVKVGDIVLHRPATIPNAPPMPRNFGMGIVTAIDTKVKGALDFEGSRLTSEHIA